MKITHSYPIDPPFLRYDMSLMDASPERHFKIFFVPILTTSVTLDQERGAVPVVTFCEYISAETMEKSLENGH